MRALRRQGGGTADGDEVPADGTEIGYRLVGDRLPLVCLPGGPGRASEYLADLGGLGRSRRLVLVDPRGVGLSADPADPASFRVDRLVSDVESLRVHLGLHRMDLLAHSAGAVLATLYAAAYPDRLSGLILVTPGLAATGVEGTDDPLRGALAPGIPALVSGRCRRAGEHLRRGPVDGGIPGIQAFYYGRWDDVAQGHATVGVSERHQAAREGFSPFAAGVGSFLS